MFQFWTKPRPGRTVTILPVNADLPVIHAPFSLGEGGAGNVAIADPRYLSFPAGPHRLAESPFDVVVLYPQNESARPVPTKSLTAAMLPLGVAVTTIIAAVDLDGDKLPDLLASEYCCQATPPLPGAGCDLACRNYYQKKSGKWIRLRHARPS